MAAQSVRRVVEKCVPRGRWLSLPDAADEFGAFMRRQLDMTVEADNLRRFRANFAADGKPGGVRFPLARTKGSRFSWPRPVETTTHDTTAAGNY